MNAFSNVIGVLTLLVVAIASISLIVGSIGIANIMLVSVVERICEIGIGFVLSTGMGLVAGVIPARNTAQLDLIDALNNLQATAVNHPRCIIKDLLVIFYLRLESLPSLVAL